MIIIGPLSDGAVTFQTAVRNHRTPIDAFRDHFGLLEGGIRLASELLCLLLIMSGRLNGFLQRGLLQSRDHAFPNFVLAHLSHQRVIHLEADAVLLYLGDDLRLRHLVSEHAHQVV